MAASRTIQWNMCSVILIHIFARCPKRFLCYCLRPSREQRMRANCYKHVLNEVSITHIIKQLRVLNAAAKQNVGPINWRRLTRQHSIKRYLELE